MADLDRPLVCSMPECQSLPESVRVCPCYSSAIAEDIRTTWSHIDSPSLQDETSDELLRLDAEAGGY